MSKKWKALHKREFEEKMDPEFLEADKQIPLIENKRGREKIEYLEPPGVAVGSLSKSPSSRLAKYFSGKQGAKSNNANVMFSSMIYIISYEGPCNK